MRGPVFLLVAVLLLGAFGCVGRFAANQSRKQASRRSDHYLKKYAEPELAALYADDPDAKVKIQNVSREGRNWLADVIVTSNGTKTRKQVLVDDKGRIIEERR